MSKSPRSPCILYPDDPVRVAWDLTLFVCIIYQAISLPMRIAFEYETSDFLFYLEMVIDSCFLMDMVFNFNTGVIIKGKLVMNRPLIVCDYLKGWFVIDLVSSTPYTWILAWSQGMSIREIESDSGIDASTQDSAADKPANLGALASTPQLLRLLKIAKLLKMLKLLRIMKIKRLLMKFEEYIVSDSMNLVVTFSNITIMICVIAHYMGCFFFYFGVEEYKNDPEKKKGWLVADDMVDKDFAVRYVTSVYWAFTTMAAVGYGEISPMENSERTYGMVIIILSSFMFAYSINSISQKVASYNRVTTMYRERMLYVN